MKTQNANRLADRFLSDGQSFKLEAADPSQTQKLIVGNDRMKKVFGFIKGSVLERQVNNDGFTGVRTLVDIHLPVAGRVKQVPLVEDNRSVKPLIVGLHRNTLLQAVPPDTMRKVKIHEISGRMVGIIKGSIFEIQVFKDREYGLKMVVQIALPVYICVHKIRYKENALPLIV